MSLLNCSCLSYLEILKMVYMTNTAVVWQNKVINYLDPICVSSNLFELIT